MLKYPTKYPIAHTNIAEMITGRTYNIWSKKTALMKLVTIKLGRKILSIKPDSYFVKSEFMCLVRYISDPTPQMTRTEKLAVSTESNIIHDVFIFVDNYLIF